MADDGALTGMELRSLVTSGGRLELSLEDVTVAEPGPDQVVVRVEATPINPSDLGLLVGPADLKTIAATGTADRPAITATIPEKRMAGMAARLDQSIPVGNEGAGTVVRAGVNAGALLGKTVAIMGGTYAQYRLLDATACVVLPDGTKPVAGAAIFVNPLTALSMVEVMRREEHKALIHTAAASNLGQMLNRICIADGIQLVNIVRSADQAAILRGIGAQHIVDSASPDFMAELTDAIAVTGATLAFDAIGGGPLANQILVAMEAALNRTAKTYSRYGSFTHKQVYIYGALDVRPTELDRSYGLSWGVSGFLVTPFLQKIGSEASKRLRARVAVELETTFASHYTAEISLLEALDPDILLAYARRATGEKYLINPAKGL